MKKVYKMKNKITKKKRIKNEWDLLNSLISYLKENDEANIFKKKKVNRKSKFEVFRFNNSFYEVEHNELCKVMNILKYEYDMFLKVDLKRNKICVRLNSVMLSLPKFKNQLPF